jgi:hypothetical protein
MAIWYIFPVLVCGNKKNLATLVGRRRECSAQTVPTDIFIASWGQMILKRFGF